MNRIEKIREKNINKRNLKIKKLEKRQKEIEIKNNDLLKKKKEFSSIFINKKSAFINSKINNISKKYDEKIKKQKIQLSKLISQKDNKRKHLLNRFLTENNIKLNNLNRKILKINENIKRNQGNNNLKRSKENFEFKVKKIKQKISDLNKMSLDDLIVENSLVCKYFYFRKRFIQKKYDKKIQKLEYKLSIAKIEKEDFDIINNNIEIDRHLNLKFINDKINKYKNLIIKEINTGNKIDHLEKSKQKEIDDLNNSNNSSPVTNYFKALKDVAKSIKSIHIFGYSINNIIQISGAHLRRYSMIYILFFVVGIFFFMTSGTNLNPDQFRLILQSNAFILIIGMAMLMVIVAGYIDLSVGSLMGFLGAFSVIILNKTGNLGLSIILTMSLGGLVGLVQGIMIGYFKIPSFIVTLGGMLLFKGLILWVTKSETIIPNIESYQEFIIGHIPDVKIGEFHLFSFLIVFICGLVASLIMLISRNKKAKYGLVNNSHFSFSLKIFFIIGMFSFFAYLMAYSLFGLHYYVIYIMILALIFMFVMQNTSFGRKIYSIGGNSKAAILSGINKGRITTYVFIITGITVGFASIVFTGIASSANPQVSGQGYELDVISSVFVGGASMSGGIGSVQGSLIGGLILGFINSGMGLLNMGVEMQYIVKSIVLVSAVGYDIFSNRKIG